MPVHTRVVVVDDDPEVGQVMADILGLEGYQVDVATGGMGGVALCQENQYAVALVDMNMPKMNGVETLRRIRQALPDIRVIMFSGYCIGELAEDAINQGAEAVLTKPLDIELLLDMLAA